MRALAITGRDDELAVQDVKIAEPGPGQVRVSVEAASVNGFDVGVASGRLWDMLPHTFPVVLGRDVAGTVERVGDGVAGFDRGERVAGVITAMSLAVGTIAEAVTVDADVLARVPDDVSSVQAAGAGLAVVAADGLVTALAPTSDDVVLVSGATGGVGSFAVQMAAATGATVLATARPGDAADHAHGLGAAHVVDHTGDLRADVEAAAPQGVTAVVHAAGDPAALAALLRPGGRLASVLGATAEATARDDITVTPAMAVFTPDGFATLLASVATGALRVPVAHTYPLDRAVDAVVDFGGHKLGKLVVSTR